MVTLIEILFLTVSLKDSAVFKVYKQKLRSVKSRLWREGQTTTIVGGN